MGNLVLIVVTAIEEHMRGDAFKRVGAAGLATFFLEINFIEGTLPKMLKAFNDGEVELKLDDCYENILLRLLACVRDGSAAAHPSLQKVLRDMKRSGTQDEMLRSLHDCLLSLAVKVLPALTQKAQLHTQCFKALQEASTAAAAAARPSRKGGAARAPRSGPPPANLQVAMNGLMAELTALEGDPVLL